MINEKKSVVESTLFYPISQRFNKLDCVLDCTGLDLCAIMIIMVVYIILFMLLDSFFLRT